MMESFGMFNLKILTLTITRLATNIKSQCIDKVNSTIDALESLLHRALIIPWHSIWMNILRTIKNGRFNQMEQGIPLN